jgi:lipopolysaccharide export system protein LptC
MRDSTSVSFVEGGSGRERAFRAATRHSRLVRFFRGAIPVSLVVILAIVLAAIYFQPLRMLSNLPVDPGRLVISGTKITMEAPRLGGFTRDGRPYELTARAAAQDLANPGVLELKDVRAHVKMRDDAVVDLNAATGLYDTKGDKMELKTDVVVSSSAGYSAHLKDASIDIKTNRIVSKSPVEVTLTNGTISANQMEVSEGGDTIRFNGDVQVNLVPQSAPAAGAAEAAPKNNPNGTAPNGAANLPREAKP